MFPPAAGAGIASLGDTALGMWRPKGMFRGADTPNRGWRTRGLTDTELTTRLRWERLWLPPSIVIMDM